MNKNDVQFVSAPIPIAEYEFTFDDVELLKLMITCKTYEEFRIQCDLRNIECIVSRREFEQEKINFPCYYETTNLTTIF